jgi:hypothetical protein
VKLDLLLFLRRLALIGIIAAAFRCQGQPATSIVELPASAVAATSQAR